MARRSPRIVDTKQRILTAALKLFGERGYYNVGVDEIAASAGVTKGALYYYFTDTADLARDLARQLWERLQADARQAFDREQDTITNLKRGFDAFFSRLQHTPEARFFLRDCRAISELNIDDAEERAGSVALMRTMLEDGMARGEIVALDPDALADVLAAACAEATLHVLATGRVNGAVQVIHRFIDGLAVPPRRIGRRQGHRDHSRPRRRGRTAMSLRP